MVVRAGQYISFIAENEGWLFDNMVQMVESELNECSHIEEPTITQVFDDPKAVLCEGLGFEHRILQLIHDLCTILNQLP
jgi:hypothetical protein